MKIVAFEVENFRSFKTRQRLDLDGDFATLIGPNGGGKTNLFDAIAIFVRKILIAKSIILPRTFEEGQWVRKVQNNSQLDHVHLERHNDRLDDPVFMSLTIEATENDILGMREVIESHAEMSEYVRNLSGWSYKFANQWTVDELPLAGHRVELKFDQGNLTYDHNIKQNQMIVEYIKNVENHKLLREELSKPSLAFPFLFLPTNRSRDGLPSSFEIVNFDIHQHKGNSESATSKTPNFQLQYLAVSRLGKLHRMTVDCEGGAREKFDKLPEIVSITKALAKLGYSWDIEVTDRAKNSYEFKISKDGQTVRLDQTSSGEREILSHVIIINGLNIRGSLILIDEPELHLHPTWQKSLQATLEFLAEDTGNQFILATHSPTFVTPRSIGNVSRCYSHNGESVLQRLEAVELPDRRHLFSMVNALNNEKIFFAEKILLVEGISDEIVLEKFRDAAGVGADKLELVRVGGKGQFDAFGRLLSALSIPFTVMADFDYLKQVGSPEVRSLFRTEKKKVEDDVLSNPGSRDGARLFDLIDAAIAGASWEEPRDLWERIKATRLGTDGVREAGDNPLLNADLERLSGQGCHILKLGEIEDYLPEGFQSKSLDRLIEITSSADFLNRLDAQAKSELESVIAKAVA